MARGSCCSAWARKKGLDGKRERQGTGVGTGASGGSPPEGLRSGALNPTLPGPALTPMPFNSYDADGYYNIEGLFA